MEKLSIERFRKIKQRLQEMSQKVNDDITDQEATELDEEINNIAEEIHNSDLSDIPFEEYSSMMFAFDYNGTHANLDFELADVEYIDRVRAKGCNLRNLDFSKFDIFRLDDDSFDEDIRKENPQYFCPEKISDPEARKRYYRGELTLDDIVTYDLKDIDSYRVEWTIRKSYEKIGLKITLLEPELFEIWNYYITDDIKKTELSKDSSNEDIEKVFRSSIERCLKEGYQYPRYGRNDYERIINNPYIKENFSDYIIDFPDDKEELKDKCFIGNLKLKDIKDNLDIFEGKKLLHRIGYSEDLRNYPEITEEKLIYFFKEFSNLSEKALTSEEMSSYYRSIFLELVQNVDIEKSHEENSQQIMEYLETLQKDDSNYDKRKIAQKLLIGEMSYEKLIEKSNISEYEKADILKIVSDPEFEKLNIDARSLIAEYSYENSKIFNFLNRFGVKTILDFEQDNGNIFTRDNGKNIKYIESAYMHYARDEWNTKSPESENDFYTQDEFEEYLRRIITGGPTDYYFRNTKFDYRTINGTFREKNPDLFLPQDAPKELQDKFYTEVITIKDLREHPEYVQYFEETNLGISLQKIFIEIDGKYGQLWELLRLHLSSKEAIQYLLDNEKLIEYLNRSGNYLNVSKDMSLDEITEKIKGEVETRILNRQIPYDEKAPQFLKEKHPDYFLKENAPEGLKKVFYTETRNNAFGTEIKQLYEENPEWEGFLLGKNLEIIDATLQKIISYSDSNQIKNIFLFYLEKQPEIALNIIGKISAKQILDMNVILDEDSIKKVIENNPSLTVKALLFSENIDRKKILALNEYKELNNSVNTIDDTLKRLYLSNTDTTYKEFNSKVDEIYNLFTYNNVPEFMKTFRLFELSKLASAQNSRIQSYQNISREEQKRIMFADLFRISLDTNNRSLRNCAETLKAGEEILRKVMVQNGGYDLSNLSEEEFAIFNQYADTLADIHNISVGLNNSEKEKISPTEDVIKNLSLLAKAYGKNGINISSTQILTELFGKEIEGELSPNDILIYMDNKREKSQKRNMQNSDRISNGELHLEDGDFIKGIRDFNSYLRSMLANGVRGGEFNRDYSHSDATPLDCDFGFVSKANLVNQTQKDSDVIGTTISGGYGSTWIVLKKYEERFSQDKQEDTTIKFTRNPEYWTNTPDNNDSYQQKDRYIRTGLGTLDIDYIVTREWEQKYGYEMAMAGIYIPVKNEDDELIFSREDYAKIREQMRGLSYYEAEDFQVDERAQNVEALFEVYRSLGGNGEKIDQVREVLAGKPDEVTASKKKATVAYMKDYFKKSGIQVADDLSSNLSKSEVELIDTGSTGRGTNVPGDGDFDFMLRHNVSQKTLSGLQSHVESLECESKTTVLDGFRVKGARLPDKQKVDIDVTYAKKDLELEYSSDMCVKDRLRSIQQSNPEQYKYVRANIIMAKNILKQMGIYKKYGSDGATEHGGFGGIGVENWILQNGGSFSKAIDTYLETANSKDANGNPISYGEFVKIYPIFDFGNNHREGKALHDRFSVFLNNDYEKGFGYVKERFSEIQEKLKALEQERDEQIQEQVTPLRASISVSEFEKESRKNPARFSKQNFVYMSQLTAKYSSRQSERSENEVTIGGKEQE